MNGVFLKESTNKRDLIAIIDPVLFDGPFDIESFSDFVKESEYSSTILSKHNILFLADAVNEAMAESSMDKIEMAISEIKEGEWENITVKKNTEINSLNENTIATIPASQAKNKDKRMTIDNTFITTGVNVGTGNIDYEGTVIVNGDVSENMQIIASGNVTINGFVESALIRSGGDIIISEGAMGKMQEDDCRLIAKGSVFLQHAQGVDIVAGKDVNIAEQLANSRVKCKGGVTVGHPDKPMGNLFASNIICQKIVRAGSVGAVSGSVLNIDFSEGFNLIFSRAETLKYLLKTLTQKNAVHETKISQISQHIIPKALTLKMASLNDELASERILLQWVQDALAELQEKLNSYETNAKVIANKELFPGVTVRLNDKIWKGEKEYMPCRIIFKNDNWQYDPDI